MSVVELLTIHRPLVTVLTRSGSGLVRTGPRRWVLAFTAAIPVVLLIGWSIADALQPATYSPVGETISVAAGEAGAHRWVGTAALFVIGIGYLIAAAVLPGLARSSRVGLLATGICGVGVAACPEAVTGPTAAHELWSVLGAALLMLGPMLTMRSVGPRGWSQRPPVVVLFTVVFAGLTGWLAYELNYGDAYGLAERLASTVEVAWPFVLVLGLRTVQPSDRAKVSSRAAA